MNDTAPAIVEAPAPAVEKRLPVDTDLSLTEAGQDQLAEAFGFKAQPAEPEAEDEPESTDEVEDDEPETEEPEETEDDAEEPESEPTYTVKVDGEEVNVPLTELLKGYSRQSDYTRKTQEVAELRKATDSELQQVRAERAHAAQLLAVLEQNLTQQQPQEPDWDNLRMTDPIEYMMQRDAWRSRNEQIQATQMQRAYLEQQQQQDFQRQTVERLKGEAEKLTAKVPEWKDAAKAKAEKQLLKEYGVQLGFAPEEMDQVADHRAVVLLRKAWLYDQAMSKRQTATQPVSKTKFSQPGQPVTQNKGKAAKMGDLKQRLAKSGSEKDFTALIHHLL